MEYKEITKTEFRNLYNIDKVLITKTSIMQYLKTYNENKQAVAFGIKKRSNDVAPVWFQEFVNKQETFNQMILKEIEGIKNDVLEIKDRLDKHDEMFRDHGWIR